MMSFTYLLVDQLHTTVVRRIKSVSMTIQHRSAMITSVTNTSVIHSSARCPTIRNVTSIRLDTQAPVRMMPELFPYIGMTQSVHRHRKTVMRWHRHKVVSAVVFETTEILGKLIWRTNDFSSLNWIIFRFRIRQCTQFAEQIPLLG